MDKNVKNIFNYLTKNEGFYMDQCKSIHSEREIWIAIKKVPQGIYVILITDDENEDIDEKEVREYLSRNEVNFSINIIVLSNKEIIREYRNEYSKVVIDIKNISIVHCDVGLEGVGNLAIELIRRSKQRNKIKIKDYGITIGLIAINIVIYIISGIMSDNLMTISNLVLVILGGKVTTLINEGEWWRVLTCNFLHGGLIHIAANMYSLYAIGPQIEVIFGKIKYIIIYILAGISSSLFSCFLSPNTMSVGASGAIFGLLGALLSFAIKEKDRINKGVITNIAVIIFINLAIGMSIPNIDNYAHFGGFLGGIVISTLFLLKGKKSYVY